MQHDLYNDCVLKTYQHTLNWFAKARSPAKGRPFNNWGKVTKSGDDFIVQVYGHQVCRISPDNTLTMLLDGAEGSIISNTLSASIHRLAPITWTRSGMKRYRILSLRSLLPGDSWWAKSKEAPELFNGLRFDLATGAALNAKPDLLERVDPEARKDWLRALRKFKSHMALRAKMGVFDAVAAELSSKKLVEFQAARGKIFANRAPNWSDEIWMNLLHTSIRDSKYSKELLAGFLLTMPSVIWSNRTKTMTMQEKVKQTVDSVINSNSVELRTRFGVFSDEVTK